MFCRRIWRTSAHLFHVQGWPGGNSLFTWCEPDTWTPAAEFHNTLSNVPYCVVGAITIHTGSQHPALAPSAWLG